MTGVSRYVYCASTGQALQALWWVPLGGPLSGSGAYNTFSNLYNLVGGEHNPR